MAFRPETPAPARGFQGEGLLAVQPSTGAPVTVIAASDPREAVASIRAELRGSTLVITADAPVTQTVHDTSMLAALESRGAGVARDLDARVPASIGTGWCSWYGYYHDVTEQVVRDELALIDRLELPIDTVQLDDGYQTGIGDWLSRRTDDFPAPLAELAARIADTGRDAGIWTAPFCVGADSDLARAHPDWLVEGAEASDQHWGQRIGVLDTTHPGAREHLVEVFTTLRDWGFRYHKIDFLYAAAIPGRRHGDASPVAAYRTGIELIREAIGDDAVLLGCGAPLLPSIGVVDAMRISPDIDPTFEPPLGDVSQPSGRGAWLMGRSRAWQHGRWWINDPDCITVRPAIERREGWVEELRGHGALAVSGDPLGALDEQGLAWTRELLSEPAPRAAAWAMDPDDELGGGFVGAAPRAELDGSAASTTGAT